MLAQTPYEPNRGLLAKVNRRITQWRCAAPLKITLDKPVLSLTFDDCPKSAISIGAKIMDAHSVNACYYIATGLLDRETEMGRIASADDVRAAFASGHEIGAHTHSHIDCATSKKSEILSDVERNLDQLADMTDGNTPNSFAYPYGETDFALKKHLSGQFTTLRGILPGNEKGRVDRAQLRAYELDGSDWRFKRLLDAMEAGADAPAWVIMFTHDVSETPSRFGMTPYELETLILRAHDLGFEIKTPREMAETLEISHV